MGLLRGRVIGNGAGIILSSDEPDYSDSLAQQGAEERGVVRLLRAESGGLCMPKSTRSSATSSPKKCPTSPRAEMDKVLQQLAQHASPRGARLQDFLVPPLEPQQHDTMQPTFSRTSPLEALRGAETSQTRMLALDQQARAGQKVVAHVATAAEKRKRILYLALSVSLIGVCIGLGATYGKQIFKAIIDAKDFLRDEPISLLTAGYFAMFTVCSLFFMPYSPFCIAIGFIFGIYWGLLIEAANVFLSSSLIFLLGRYLVKDYVEAIIAKSEGSTAVTMWRGLSKFMDRDWREAAKINVLLCFIPMPYGMNRYLFSLTNVPFVSYNAFFLVGMIPNTSLNLLIGVALAQASDAENDGNNTVRMVGTGVAIVGILSAIWYAKGVAQKILKESRRKEAEEALEAGRPICEHKRVDVVGDGDVILQMRIH